MSANGGGNHEDLTYAFKRLLSELQSPSARKSLHKHDPTDRRRLINGENMKDGRMEQIHRNVNTTGALSLRGIWWTGHARARSKISLPNESLMLIETGSITTSHGWTYKTDKQHSSDR